MSNQSQERNDWHCKKAISSLISLYIFPASSYVSLIEIVLVWKLRWLETSIVVFVMPRWSFHSCFHCGLKLPCACMHDHEFLV
jgi:hypothetical protein